MVPNHLPYCIPKPPPDNETFSVSFYVELEAVIKSCNQRHFQMDERKQMSSNINWKRISLHKTTLRGL